MSPLRIGAIVLGAVLTIGTSASQAIEIAPSAGRTAAARAKATTARQPTKVVFETASIDSLARLFDGLGFRLELVSHGTPVPRVIVASLPDGMRKMKSIKDRTRLFRRILLPLVLVTNEEIMADRRRLLALKRKQEIGASLTAAESVWLWSLAHAYKVKDGDLKELVRRVDAIPPSLAIAQAIEESGWGTSAYARKGNAIFGQETYLAAADGMDGKHRGRKFKIKVFPSLRSAVKSYARNLNTHFAYKKMRAERALARARGETPKGYLLIGTLIHYSERGKAYIRTIRQVMDNFDLRGLDEAGLAKGNPTIFVFKPSPGS